MKNAGTKVGQERAELILEIMGTQGLGWEGEGFTSEELAAVRGWLGGKATTIFGGSHEIQNNIISKRILGLPDPLRLALRTEGRIEHGRSDRRTKHAARRGETWTQEKSPGLRLPQDARFRRAARLRPGRLRRDGGDGLDRRHHPRGVRRLRLRLPEPRPDPRGDRPHADRLAAAGHRRWPRPAPSSSAARDAQKEAWLPKIAAGEAGRHAGHRRRPAPRAGKGRAGGQEERRGLHARPAPRPSCSKAWPPASSSSRPAPPASRATRTASPSSSCRPTPRASPARR